METLTGSFTYFSARTESWNRIAVGGDSAGGNLAAAVTLRARDEHLLPNIKLQLLIYPVINYSFDTSSYEEFKNGYMLYADKMKWYWKMYLQKPEDGYHPYASPVMAKDLSGLPDTFIQVAEWDILRDEGLQYAEALSKAGTKTKLQVYNEIIHGFFHLGSMFNIANEAIHQSSEFIKQLHN